MAASQADIEEFLAGPLVSWLATCVKKPDGLQVYETFFDGAPISEVLLLIDPEPSQPVPTSGASLQGLSITATRIKIFHCIVKNIKSLYEVSYLSTLGGRDLTNHVNNALRFLMDDNLAKHFS